jgi:hypothetical protein
VRMEVPPDLTPEQERAVIAALERHLAEGSVRPSPWALAGRVENLGLGALQGRHQSPRAWRDAGRDGFTRRGADTRMGRGDSK